MKEKRETRTIYITRANREGTNEGRKEGRNEEQEQERLSKETPTKLETGEEY